MAGSELKEAMAFNEWHQWHGSPSHHQPPYGAPRPEFERPRVQEDTLAERLVEIDRKSFRVTLCENPRGRFLRVTEDSRGRRNTIIVPSTGLVEFFKHVTEMVNASESLPQNPNNPPPTPP